MQWVRHNTRSMLVLATAGLAVAAPTLLNAGSLPLVGMPTSLLALLGWGLWSTHVAALTAQDGDTTPVDSGLGAVLLLLLGLCLATAVSAACFGTPCRIVVRQGIGLVFAMVVALCAGRLMRREADGRWRRETLVRALFVAVVVAGTANALIAWLQFFAPGSMLGGFPTNGRATGYLRQPNLLATLVLMALAASVACRQALRLPAWLFAGLYVVLTFALALSLSRMGAVASAVPALWGLLDRHLKRSTRWALLLLPVALAISWWAALAMDHAWGLSVGVDALSDRTTLASSRWGLWRQSLLLISQNPWFGVGWGQFNFAWTLTAMPDETRSPKEMFTHAHNLFIQWAVELGVPAACALAILLGWALWRALQLLRSAQGSERAWRSAGLVMVLIVLFHSQLEYPLWQTGFLLTTCCLAGVALGTGAVPALHSTDHARRKWGARIAAVLLLLGTTWVAHDYRLVSQLYSPDDQSTSDDQRIGIAQRSLLFGHFGDRYAGTLAPRGQRSLKPYCDIVYEQLDIQLLYAWTLAQAEAGEVQKARYLAAQLKEFDRPLTRSFFEVCKQAAGARAFQCEPPHQDLSFRDLRPSAALCGRR